MLHFATGFIIGGSLGTISRLLIKNFTKYMKQNVANYTDVILIMIFIIYGIYDYRKLHAKYIGWHKIKTDKYGIWPHEHFSYKISERKGLWIALILSYLIPRLYNYCNLKNNWKMLNIKHITKNNTEYNN